MDIRKETVLIVRKGKQYVQTVSVITSGTIWTTCQYDAWRTRDINEAIRQARDVDGEIWLFNPIIGTLRPADMSKLKKMEDRKHDRADLQQAEGNPQE